MLLAFPLKVWKLRNIWEYFPVHPNSDCIYDECNAKCWKQLSKTIACCFKNPFAAKFRALLIEITKSVWKNFVKNINLGNFAALSKSYREHCMLCRVCYNRKKCVYLNCSHFFFFYKKSFSLIFFDFYCLI